MNQKKAKLLKRLSKGNDYHYQVLKREYKKLTVKQKEKMSDVKGSKKA